LVEGACFQEQSKNPNFQWEERLPNHGLRVDSRWRRCAQNVASKTGVSPDRDQRAVRDRTTTVEVIRNVCTLGQI
jgi:hypothetical protein